MRFYNWAYTLGDKWIMRYSTIFANDCDKLDNENEKKTLNNIFVGSKK